MNLTAEKYKKKRSKKEEYGFGTKILNNSYIQDYKKASLRNPIPSPNPSNFKKLKENMKKTSTPFKENEKSVFIRMTDIRQASTCEKEKDLSHKMKKMKPHSPSLESTPRRKNANRLRGSRQSLDQNSKLKCKNYYFIIGNIYLEV